MSDQVALNRLGEPQDIANAVSFLLATRLVTLLVQFYTRKWWFIHGLTGDV